MKYLNSVKMLIGILKILAGIVGVYIIIHSFIVSDEDVGLKIIYSLIIGLVVFFAFVFGIENVRDAIHFVREHSKQERYELNDLLIGREKGGKIQ